MSRVSQPGLAADNSASALTDITITYTTDDPGTVADGAITIADGDATAGMAAALDEFEAAINAINAVLRRAGIAR
jgi:hypothetical protein